MSRKGKTLAQQCKFYDCENFVSDVMLYHYNCGNKKGMVEDYKELNKEARQIVVQQILVKLPQRAICSTGHHYASYVRLAKPILTLTGEDFY